MLLAIRAMDARGFGYDGGVLRFWTALDRIGPFLGPGERAWIKANGE